MIKDIWTGNDKYQFPYDFKSINNKLFFVADDGVHGKEVWVSDGTETGTHFIDIVEGPVGSNPSLFTDVYGVTYFKADASLWRTNGTALGTFKVSDLEPLDIRALDSWVYLIAPHQDYGVELFKVKFDKLAQQIAFESVSSKTFGGPTFQINASASSGLPIVFSSSDELSLLGQTATIVKPGSVSLIAEQPGDVLFNAASESQTFCILPAKPTISTLGSDEGHPTLTSSANVGNQWFEEDVLLIGATDKSFTPKESGIFKTHVIIDGCISEFSEEEVVVITGIESMKNIFVVYPNPAHNTLNIKKVGDFKNISIDVVDINGRPITKLDVSSDQIIEHSLASYPKGVYLLKINSEKGITYQKFVKE